MFLVQSFYNYKQFDAAGERNTVAELLDMLVNEKGICQLKPLLKDMPKIEPEREYDPMSAELRAWAMKHGLKVRAA